MSLVTRFLRWDVFDNVRVSKFSKTFINILNMPPKLIVADVQGALGHRGMIL